MARPRLFFFLKRPAQPGPDLRPDTTIYRFDAREGTGDSTARLLNQALFAVVRQKRPE